MVTSRKVRAHAQEDGDEIVRRVKAALVPQKAAAQNRKEVADSVNIFACGHVCTSMYISHMCINMCVDIDGKTAHGKTADG